MLPDPAGIPAELRHQPLPEGVVQRVVDDRRRDAKSARGRAIDVDIGLQAVVLQVARHIGEHGGLSETIDQSWHQRRKLFRIGVLDSELILRATHPILDGQILRRLHVQPDAFDVG